MLCAGADDAKRFGSGARVRPRSGVLRTVMSEIEKYGQS